MECFYRKYPNQGYEAVHLDKLQVNVHSAVSSSVTNPPFSPCVCSVYENTDTYVQTEICVSSEQGEGKAGGV